MTSIDDKLAAMRVKAQQTYGGGGPARVTTVMPHKLSDGSIVERADRRTAGSGENRLPVTRVPPQPTIVKSDAGAFRRELERRLAEKKKNPSNLPPLITGAKVTMPGQSVSTIPPRERPRPNFSSDPTESVGKGFVPPGGMKMR
jgi:hypothetical protein